MDSSCKEGINPIEEIRGYIGKSMKMTLCNGRAIHGRCVCLDWLGNIMVSGAQQFLPMNEFGGKIIVVFQYSLKSFQR